MTGQAPTCFCSHCERSLASAGLDVARLREASRELQARLESLESERGDLRGALSDLEQDRDGLREKLDALVAELGGRDTPTSWAPSCVSPSPFHPNVWY